MSDEKPGTDSMSVQIRVLTVGGKKMPVGVYEQLQQDVLGFEKGEPVWKVWGFVERHSGCFESDHLHVVFEVDGGQLRRDTVVFAAHGADAAAVEESLRKAGQLFIGT